MNVAEALQYLVLAILVAQLVYVAAQLIYDSVLLVCWIAAVYIWAIYTFGEQRCKQITDKAFNHIHAFISDLFWNQLRTFQSEGIFQAICGSYVQSIPKNTI